MFSFKYQLVYDIINSKSINKFSCNQSWHPPRCQSATRPTRHLQSDEKRDPYATDNFICILNNSATLLLGFFLSRNNGYHPMHDNLQKPPFNWH